MKKSIYFKTVVIFLLISTLFACEEVIELDLEESSPTIIIESMITDTAATSIIKISKSVSFYSSVQYQKVSGAEAYITDANNIKYLFFTSPDGLYINQNLLGVPDNEYELTVLCEGKTYAATTIFPKKIELDSLNYEWAENPHYKGYSVNLFFRDPANNKNYYRIIIYKNGKLFKDEESGNEIIIWDDKLFDGKNTRIPAKRGGTFFNLNDTITIELQSINYTTYQYYNTLKNALATSPSIMQTGKSMMEGAAAPANPDSNFDNALGYFGAASISKKSIIIK